MSGPKIDKATVRRLEMERLAKAREERKKACQKVQEIISKVRAVAGIRDSIMMQDDFFRASYERIDEKKVECCKELDGLCEIIKSGDERLDTNHMLQKANMAMAKFNDSIKDELALSSRLATNKADRQRLEQANKKKMVILTEENSINKEETVEQNVDESIEAFEEEIKAFLASENITAKHKNTILLINHDLQVLEKSDISADRKIKKVKRLFTDYEKVVSRIKNEMRNMDVLYEEYLRECFDLSAPARSLSDFSSEKEIEDAILDAKRQGERGISTKYIKRQIDEVMAKHGYDVIKSDMLSATTQSGQILYGVDDDTAIDVFVSGENQVTMRVVGIGFDSDISEDENDRLFQQQCAFCSIHPQITAELELRGVILQPQKHMPPAHKFNKKVQTKSGRETKSSNRAKRELSRTELKKMRKE